MLLIVCSFHVAASDKAIKIVIFTNARSKWRESHKW